MTVNAQERATTYFKIGMEPSSASKESSFPITVSSEITNYNVSEAI